MTIYDAIGGSTAVAATVDLFYERVLAGARLTHYFEGVDVKRLKGHQRGFIAAAIGGPELYTGRSMREAHSELHIRPEHFNLVVGHLVDTMTSLNVPESIIGQVGATLMPLRNEIAPALEDPAADPEDGSLDAAS